MTWPGIPEICPNDDSCAYWWDADCDGVDGRCPKHQKNKENKMNQIQQACETMRRAFRKDSSFEYGYVSDIAMLLHDHYGITDQDTRNKAAREILQLIFGQDAECNSEKMTAPGPWPEPPAIEEEEKIKIFCTNCKFLTSDTDLMEWVCDHPGNLEDNWCKLGGGRKMTPKYLNKNNDCGWYEPKTLKKRDCGTGPR